MYTLGRPTYADFLTSGGATERFDAIFIGSGISALTAAVLLARRGKRVLILESHHTPGGLTHAFSRKGFVWDAGVHYVGDVHVPRTRLARFFESLSEGRLQWASMGDVYDRAVFPGFEFAFRAGAENLRADLHARYPHEAAGIDTYLALLDRASASADRFFAEKALPPALSRLIGPFLRRGFANLAHRTTREVLRELFADEELIALLTTQWGDCGLPPSRSSFGIHALIARHYLRGSGYPVGGASQIAQSIVPSITERGGRIVLRAKVRNVLVANGRACGVVMEDGVEIRAPLVVSAAGLRNSAQLVRDGSASESAAPTLDALARELPGTEGYLGLYVGLNRSSADLQLPRENRWEFPSLDHDGNTERYLADPEAPFPLLFYSFPSARDPEWERAHPGTSLIEVVTLARYDWFAAWEGARVKQRGPEYGARKAEFQRRMEAALLRALPQLQGSLLHSELSTPLTLKHYCQWPRGETYGLAHSPARYAARALRPHTEVRGLYLTGQDIVSCGVAGALASGIVTASAILGRDCGRELLDRPDRS